MTAKTIAKALGGRKACCSWMARCPTHKDRTPSLAITDTKDGNVLVRSHSGYRQCNVIEAVRGRGLWESACRPYSSSRITAWRVEDIHQLIESAEQRYAGVETRLRRHALGRGSNTSESPRTGHDSSTGSPSWLALMTRRRCELNS